VGGIALGDACTSTSKNSNHCSYLDGDATCQDRYGTDRPFCGGDCVDSEGGDGCVEERPTANDCYYPCGNDMTVEDDQSCGDTETMTDTLATTLDTSASDPSGDPTTSPDDSSSVTNTTMTQGSETDPSETTESGGDCQMSADCVVPGFPVCLDHDCVACTDTPEPDMACSSKDEAVPVCNPDGECVQCNDGNAAACADMTPVCDAGTSTCVGCTYHEQCSESACRIATGECFDSAEVYDVGSGETYASITAAHADLGDGAQVVLLLHAGASFDESVVISGANTAYAFLAADEVPQWINSTGGASSLVVESGAEAYAQDVRFTLNADFVAATADAASLYFDRVQVLNNSAGSVSLVADANAQIRSSFLGGNFNDVTVLGISDSTLDATYITVLGGGATARAIACSPGGSATIRNSLIVATTNDPEISCSLAAVTYSATEADTPGTGNVALDDMATNWFVAVNTNLRLTGNAPAEILSTAQWQTGDPASDIDGTPRPSVDGTADVAGAHLP
jgi:hypothetical protein